MICIDGSNIKWGLDNYNNQWSTKVRIDYQKLITTLVAGRQLVRSIYYCSVPVPPSDPDQIKFHEYLRSLNIQIVPKELKSRYDSKIGAPRSYEKGVDVALATDLLAMAWENAYDVAILVSGDADYIGAVSKVMSKGKNVELVGFKGRIASDLRKNVIKTTQLDDIMDQIKRI